jgi:hypothetical protein
VRPSQTYPLVKASLCRVGLALACMIVLLVPHGAIGKVVNAFPPQPLLAVGRSNVSGKASVGHCHERFAELLQSRIDACRGAGGHCYCRDDETYPLYQKYYPAQRGYDGVWVTSRRMTFRCWKVTPPDTCGRCIRMRP